MGGAGLLDQARGQWAAYLSDLWRSGGWDDQPDDERDYSQRHLAEHLDEAGVPDAELHALIDQRWLRAWWAHEGTYEGFLADVDRAWRRAERARDLIAQIKCALCTTGGAALSERCSPDLLAAAVEHGVLAPEQALSLVRRAAQSERARRLIALAPHLPPYAIDTALDIVQSLTVVYAHIKNRNDVLTALAPHVPPMLQARALELASGISSNDKRALAIVGLAPHFDQEQVGPLLTSARALTSNAARATALTAMLPRLGGTELQSTAQEACDAARLVTDYEARADTLTALLATVHGPLRSKVWRSALTTARNISASRIASVDAREDDDLRAEKLAALLPHATGPRQKAALARETLTIIKRIRSSNSYSPLREAMAHVPADLWSLALDVALSVDDGSVPHMLEIVAPYLTPLQCTVAARRVGRVRSRDDRVKALLVLAKQAGGRSRRHLADRIVPLLRHLDENDRASALVDVAALAEPATLRRLLPIARRIRDAGFRAAALSGIAPLLPVDLAAVAISEAWTAVASAKDERRRLHTLTTIFPFATGHLRSRLERAGPSLVKAVGSDRLDSGTIYGHARMLVRLGRIDDAFAALAFVQHGEERSECLTNLAGRLPVDHQVRAVRAALDAARESDDESALAAFMAAAEPNVDLDDLSCTEQMKARAGFYARDESEDEDVDSEEEDEDANGEPNENGDEDEDGDNGDTNAEHAARTTNRDVDLDAEIERVNAMDDENDRAEALQALARMVPQSVMGKLLEVARNIPRDDYCREALAKLAKRLAPEHWPQAFDVADSINDTDEHAEALILIALQAPEPHRRMAQERALEAIAAAFNEDDYDEPLLRLAMAEDYPTELFPRVLEVAADLHQHQDDERRARAFTGLAQDFGLWVKRDKDRAHAGWSDALRRMARRPRPEFLRDLAGFHHLGRLMVRPKRRLPVRSKKEERYITSLREMVARVGAWR